MNPILKRALAWTSAVVVAAGTFAAGTWYGEYRLRAHDPWADGRLLSTAIDSVRANALDSLPNDELIRRAVAGMLRELHDPYAALMRPDSYQRYRGSMQGEGQGIGISLRRQLGATTVSRVAEGSPAASAGVRAGDRIIAVNGVPIGEGWGRRAGDTTSAPRPTATLSVWRAPSPDTFVVEVKRGPWHTPAVVDAAMLADSVGYVSLTTITARSSAELEDAVERLRARGATSLILDLRGNAGGLFEEGVKAAGLFLPRGALVASLEGRRGAPAERHVARESRWPTLPLTVLVDGGTASAAEIIAAAMRDHGRALLVGTPTYGKGVVQRVVKLSPELSLRLTTARWLTPNGYSLQRRTTATADHPAQGGLLPDVSLDDAMRRDPTSAPRDWTKSNATRLAALADSAVLNALRDRWQDAATPLLESRVRTHVTELLPRNVRSATQRANWTNTATRIVTARVLEIAGSREALLRYGTREDAALRAGLDILAPGASLASVLLAAPDEPSVAVRRDGRLDVRPDVRPDGR